MFLESLLGRSNTATIAETKIKGYKVNADFKDVSDTETATRKQTVFDIIKNVVSEKTKNKRTIMTESANVKSTGGIAPFDYRWHNSTLLIDETEAPVRKLIYELFLKHRRKKTVARLLNDLGYRTRNGALFSDTTIDRLLRDTTVKGIKIVNGKEIEVPSIISIETWERANNFLGSPKSKPTIHLFIGFAFCGCGGKMFMPSNVEKYVCPDCRHKIGATDLEEIFTSQLAGFPIELGNNSNLANYWQDLTQKEKQIIIEQYSIKSSSAKLKSKSNSATRLILLKRRHLGNKAQRATKL